MSYEIELTRRAEKEILKLDAAIFAQIRAAIDGLGENPRPLGVQSFEAGRVCGAFVWGASASSTLFRTPLGEFLSTVLPTERMCIAGDMQRGQSLIVWAIAEGRSAARGEVVIASD